MNVPRTVLLTVLVALAATVALPATAAASEQQDAYTAARVAAKALRRAKAHARVHARCLGKRVPARLLRRHPSPIERGETWRDVGAETWRALADERVEHTRQVRAYVKRTWRQIRFPRGSSPYRWIPLARHVGWPERAIPMLRRVILRESRGNPRCVTGVHHGLMQIRRDHSPSVNLLNPAANLVIGLRMWRAKGWVPWAATAW